MAGSSGLGNHQPHESSCWHRYLWHSLFSCNVNVLHASKSNSLAGCIVLKQLQLQWVFPTGACSGPCIEINLSLVTIAYTRSWVSHNKSVYCSITYFNFGTAVTNFPFLHCYSTDHTKIDWISLPTIKLLLIAGIYSSMFSLVQCPTPK